MNDVVEFYTNSIAYAATGLLSWLGVLLGFCGSVILFYIKKEAHFLLVCLGTIPFVLEPGMASIFPLAWSEYDSTGNIIAQASYPNFPWVYALIKAIGVFLLGAGLFLMGMKSIAPSIKFKPRQ